MSSSASSSSSELPGTLFSSESSSSTTRCSSSVSTCLPIRGNGNERPDFASTALWAVILATVLATILLSVILWLTKRRVRRRSREQIRAFLWDMVRGVQNGTVEEDVLRRIIYGADPEVLEPKTPAILETWMFSNPIYSTNLTKFPSATSFRTTPSDREWKWNELQPVSLTKPFSPSDPFGLHTPDYGPKPALLQLPWKTHSRTEPETLREEADVPLSRVGTTAKPAVAERQVDAIFLIAMPQLRTPGSGSQAIVSLPVTLASASPTFEEDFLDPIVPPKPKRALAIQRQPRLDPLSSSGRHIEGPGISWFGETTRPVRSVPLPGAAGATST